MFPQEVVIEVDPKNMLSYMEELITNEEEYRRLVVSPREQIKEKLGIEIQEEISVKRDYSPLNQEDIQLLNDLFMKDITGNLPSDVLEFSSNRLAIFIAIAIAVAIVKVRFYPQL